MLGKKVDMEERDLGKQPLSEAELDELIGARNYLEFLNSRNEMYRAMNMKDQPPSRQQAIRLMSKNPNLIRRPIIRKGPKWMLGFDAQQLESLMK